MSKRVVVFLVTVTALLLCWVLFGQDNGYDPVTPPTPVILNGDVNADGMWCMDDPVQIIYHLYRDGRELPCRDAADVDRNGTIDVNDVVLSLRFLFFGDYINDCPVTCDGYLHKTD